MKLKDGMKIYGIIEEKEVKGEIAQEENDFFFLQNRCDGNTPPSGNLRGYKYSWIFQHGDEAGEYTNDVEILKISPRAIKIETEKIVVKGEKHRKILSIEALGKEDLPEKYLDDAPAVWKNEKSLSMRVKWGLCALTQNNTYPEEYFQEAKELIAQAGERLGEVNRQLRKENFGWEGEETFYI